MSSYGYHAGTANAKNVRVDGKFVPNARILLPKDFDVSDIETSHEIASGTTFTKGKAAAVLSGIGAWVITRYFAPGADNAVCFTEIVPSSIPRKARAEVTVYYTASGVQAAVLGGDGIVWDLDYSTFDIFVSGTSVTGYDYTVNSGVVGNKNATATGEWLVKSISGSTVVNLSGTVSSATIVIPAFDVRPNSIIRAVLYRDVGESADDLPIPAHLIAAKIEYVE